MSLQANYRATNDSAMICILLQQAAVLLAIATLGFHGECGNKSPRQDRISFWYESCPEWLEGDLSLAFIFKVKS